MPLVPVWHPETHEKQMVHSVDAREMARHSGYLTVDPNSPAPITDIRPIGLTDDEWDVILAMRGKKIAEAPALAIDGAAKQNEITAAAASGEKIAPNGQKLDQTPDPVSDPTQPPAAAEPVPGTAPPAGTSSDPAEPNAVADGAAALTEAREIQNMTRTDLEARLDALDIPHHPNAKDDTLRQRLVNALKGDG